MIIVSIANQKYALASLQDAEALMLILDRATPVEDHYRGDYQNSYLVEDPSPYELTIAIKRTELVSADEHASIQAEKAARRAETNVAEIKAA
jgi:hypothetical protein